MRTPFAISSTARLLGATLALALMAAPAHAADAPFTPRFAQTARGDVAAVGNTVLTCPTATPGCANAQNGIGAALTTTTSRWRTSTSTPTAPPSTPRRPP